MILSIVLTIVISIVSKINYLIPEGSDLPTQITTPIDTLFGWFAQINNLFPVDTVMLLMGLTMVIILAVATTRLIIFSGWLIKLIRQIVIG